MEQIPYILAIESSCDDTSAAVLYGNKVLSNEVASQEVHTAYGGVVPELASRAHQQNIVPVVDRALKVANIKPSQLHAIAFTNGPGLMGSLLRLCLYMMFGSDTYSSKHKQYFIMMDPFMMGSSRYA